MLEPSNNTQVPKFILFGFNSVLFAYSNAMRYEMYMGDLKKCMPEHAQNKKRKAE